MSAAEEQLFRYWAGTERKVSIWADSTYGPLEQKEILKLAQECAFPLSCFNCAFGAGLTCKADFHDPIGTPADIVIIERGYNDDSAIGGHQARTLMYQQKWYSTLKNSVGQVKFVIFVHQPSYKQTCPPVKKKKQKAKPFHFGKLTEGSKYAQEAVGVVEELGIPAFILKGSPQELFGNMLRVDADGALWQNEAVNRSYAQKDEEYTESGELALWSDGEHPTAKGAALHFKCVVALLRKRFEVPESRAPVAPAGAMGASAVGAPSSTGYAPVTPLFRPAGAGLLGMPAQATWGNLNKPAQAAPYGMFARPPGGSKFAFGTML